MAQHPADRPPSLKVLAEPPPPTPPDDDATYLDRLVNLGLLNVYGFGGVMSRRVRADVAFAGMLIVIQAGIDFMAWFLGMKLVLSPALACGWDCRWRCCLPPCLPPPLPSLNAAC